MLWLQSEIREWLISSWTDDQHVKVREVAAFLVHPQTSRAVHAVASAFGHPEVCAWRFLRSCWDLEVAIQRLHDTARWRADCLAKRRGIDGSKAFQAEGGWPQVPATEAGQRIFVGRRLFPCVGWDGGVYDVGNSHAEPRWWNSFDGTPVEYWQVGRIDVHEVCSKFSQDDLMDCYMEYNERRRERVNSMHAAGFIVIADASGVGLTFFRNCIRHAWRASLVLEMGERHFPGSIRRMFIVNAPSFIHAIFRAVQPVVSDATRQSLTITASSAEEVQELRELLPEGMLDSLRVALG